jgi:hypothetical protein
MDNLTSMPDDELTPEPLDSVDWMLEPRRVKPTSLIEANRVSICFRGHLPNVLGGEDPLDHQPPYPLSPRGWLDSNVLNQRVTGLNHLVANVAAHITALLKTEESSFGVGCVANDYAVYLLVGRVANGIRDQRSDSRITNPRFEIHEFHYSQPHPLNSKVNRGSGTGRAGLGSLISQSARGTSETAGGGGRWGRLGRAMPSHGESAQSEIS